MAKRYWTVNWGYGYAGTDNTEEVDLVDYFGYTEKEVEELPDEEAERQINDDFWNMATERVEVWCEPKK